MCELINKDIGKTFYNLDNLANKGIHYFKENNMNRLRSSKMKAFKNTVFEDVSLQ